MSLKGVESIVQLVRVYVRSMAGTSGSITLHVHEGKVTRIEKRDFVSTATLSLDPT